MTKLRLAIIGCGDIAGFTALFTRLNRGIAMTACCDISQERAKKFAKANSIPQVFTDYTELLKSAPVDAVYLAVPHNLHFPMMKQAIAAGKHIFAEKPVTRTLAEGLEIVEMAERAGVKVAVNYQYRYDSGCYRMARTAQSGQLGEIRYARINIPWHREQGYFDGSAWHKTIAQAGGGTLITQGSHFLDVALWACGSRPMSASGMITRRAFREVEVEDLAMGVVELENVALVEICSSMAAASEQAASIELYGSKATAIYSDRPLPHVKFLGGKVKAERMPIFGVHALQRSIEGFRRWIMFDERHLVTGRDSLTVLAAVEAIYRSAESSQRSKVESPPFGFDL